MVAFDGRVQVVVLRLNRSGKPCLNAPMVDVTGVGCPCRVELPDEPGHANASTASVKQSHLQKLLCSSSRKAVNLQGIVGVDELIRQRERAGATIPCLLATRQRQVQGCVTGLWGEGTIGAHEKG